MGAGFCGLAFAHVQQLPSQELCGLILGCWSEHIGLNTGIGSTAIDAQNRRQLSIALGFTEWIT